MRARARGMTTHVAIVTRAARGGMLKKHVTRTLPNGTVEEEREWAMPDWRASAFILERQAPAEFGRRETISVGPADGVEPAVDGSMASGDLGSQLGKTGLERLAANLLEFRARQEIEAGPADEGADVVDAEVEEETG